MPDNFPSQSKTMATTCPAIQVNMSTFVQHWLPSFDDQPADKEHKAGKKQYVQEVAVVSKFCHR